MKKVLSFLLVICSLPGWAQSSSFRINLYSNYVFDDQVDSYYSTTAYYDGKIKGGFQWGAGFEYMIKPAYGINLTYYRQGTNAPITYYDPGSVLDPVKTQDFDLVLNYILLGGTRYLLANPRVEPYFGIDLGMCILDVSNTVNGNDGSATKFAWGIRGGTNIWATERFGIKLQAGLNSVTQGVGGSLYFGTGGAGAGVASYSSLLQFSLGGGLAFRLGYTTNAAGQPKVY